MQREGAPDQWLSCRHRTRSISPRAHPLTAALLAYNLLGGSFFAASCRLGGKTAGHFLRIFKHIERIYLAHRT